MLSSVEKLPAIKCFPDPSPKSVFKVKLKKNFLSKKGNMSNLFLWDLY